MGSPISKARKNLDSIDSQRSEKVHHSNRNDKEVQNDLARRHDHESVTSKLQCDTTSKEDKTVSRSTFEEKPSNRQEDALHQKDKTLESSVQKSPLLMRQPIVAISSSSSSSFSLHSSSSSSDSSSSATKSMKKNLFQSSLVTLTQNNTPYKKNEHLPTGSSSKVTDHSSFRNHNSSFDDDDLESEGEVYDWLSSDSLKQEPSSATKHPSKLLDSPTIQYKLHQHQTLKTPKNKPLKSNISFTPPGWDSPLNLSMVSLNSTMYSDHHFLQRSVKSTRKVNQKNAQLPSDKPLVTKGNWLTNRLVVNNYIILHSLGKGSYGEVRLSRKKDSNELYAVKIVNKRKNASNALTYNDDIKTEVAIMKKLKHENCVSLYEVMDDPKVKKLYLVMEYMQGGDLMQIMGGKAMKEQDIWDITVQLIRGIRYLHQNNIIHGDLKPQNLLVSSNGTIKIGDFGLSKMIEENQMQKECVGTPAFVSPEVCSGELSFDGKKADMYSMGATMYYITFCKTPFEARSLTLLYAKILNNDISFPFEINHGLEKIIRGLMKKSPLSRLSMNDLVDAPWLQTRPGEIISLKNISPLIVTNKNVDVSEHEIFNSIKDLSG